MAVDDSNQEGPTYLKRASTEKLREIFLKYATQQRNGDFYMTSNDFVKSFLGYTGNTFGEESIKLLAGIADTSKDGLISFSEFQAFEGLLCSPDALYKTAFQLFDIAGNGTVSYSDFVHVIQKTDIYKNIQIDTEFIQRYFGKEKKREINYVEFSQFLHDFHEECALEAFKMKDPTGSGYISALDFQDIMVKVKKHLLTNEVKDNLVALTEGHKVSFPYFMAFNSLLNNMELIKRIYLNATSGTRTQQITKDELLYSAQMMSQITPLEIDILFQLTGVIHQSGKLVYSDLSNIAPEHYIKHITTRLAEIKAVSSPADRGIFIQMLESVYRFSLGAIAGAVGATAVYPIDLVKTRMQNQRTGSFIGEEIAYRNSWDCCKKVIRHEGILGLYRGLVPQLLGVAPEKAIKLTVNDLVRDKLSDSKGNLLLHAEVIAGACAGGSQVIFTNPLEIVKIRLQVSGEIVGGQNVRALTVVRELGLFGLYKGARACLLRDVPFSAIYFPMYAHTKAKFADEDGYNHPLTLLAAGAIAGVPAASLVTPADVIKTRLQVVARTGQTTYTGVLDAARKITKEEGFRALWKGTTARVFRSSPQFGVTLVTYELLQRLFYVDFGGSRPTGSDFKKAASLSDISQHSHVDHIGGYQVAIPMLNGIETKFGLSLPRFASTVKPNATIGS